MCNAAETYQLPPDGIDWRTVEDVYYKVYT